MKVFFALRWDDLIKERYLLKDNPDLSLKAENKLRLRIREMFYSHNKGPRDDSEKNVVEEKILNTVDFTLGCCDTPIEPIHVYKSE